MLGNFYMAASFGLMASDHGHEISGCLFVQMCSRVRTIAVQHARVLNWTAMLLQPELFCHLALSCLLQDVFTYTCTNQTWRCRQERS